MRLCARHAHLHGRAGQTGAGGGGDRFLLAEERATPKAYTIDLAWKALALARKFGDGDAANLERLDDIRAELEEYGQPGLTEKNRAVIRQVLADEVWRSVMALPATLMAEAARQQPCA